MTISVLIPAEFDNEEGKNKLKDIFHQEGYPIEEVEIGSFQDRYETLQTLAYIDIQDKTVELENEVIQRFKANPPKLTQKFDLRPKICLQEISIKDLSNNYDFNEESIKKICQEAKAKLVNKSNSIRMRGKKAYVDLENLEEANKVVDFLRNNDQTLKIQLEDSELDKVKKRKSKSNNDSNQRRNEQKQKNIEIFYKNSDYQEVNKNLNEFIFLLCTYLSDLENDQKNSE